MGFERAEGVGSGEGTGRGGEGEIGAERRRQESRELASPSANFITELVVFAQIISIYSTQAGNLFASECMREWNLPPRSRLAPARARARSHVCPMSGCTDGWLMEMGARMRPCTPCKRATRRRSLFPRISAK